MIESPKITIKQIVFFWCIFHFVGYLSFVTGLTPGIKKEQYGSDKNYILTPDYEVIPEEYEEENFYPFHKFTYDIYRNGSGSSTFVGIWGYYGHYEFLFYIVLPLLIYLLILVYRRFVRD